MAMDPDIKARWVADLRENISVQGSGALCIKGRYCCLGRLCEVAAAPKYTDSCGWTIYTMPTGERCDLAIDPDFCGIGKEACMNLMAMNDDGKTFAEIADWIEANL